MRKYIKSMRQQNENKSYIFKQAKKMFHYEPTAQNKPFGLSKPGKGSKASAKQFKDDFSSVKDNRVENNEINESSWIGRLVNGIQEHSLEDLRVCSKQIVKRLSDGVQNVAKQIDQKAQSQNIIIIDKKRETKTRAEAKLNKSMDNEAPTKKNSVIVAKKKSDTFTEKKYKAKEQKTAFQQHQIAEKENMGSISRSKSQSRSLSRNVSQSIIAKTEVSTKKEFGSKKKSLQNIYIYKGTEESKSKVSASGDHCRLQTQKSVQKSNKMACYQDEAQKNKAQELRFNQSISEMQQIKCLTDNKMEILKQIQAKQKAAQLLDESFSQPLFQESKLNQKHVEQVNVQKPKGFGLIRKNNRPTSNRQQKSSNNCSLKQQQVQTKVSPKFSSNYLDLRKVAVQKQSEGEDFVSARQQKQLVDKYLRKDYSFKCQTTKYSDSHSPFLKQPPLNKTLETKYNYQALDNGLTMNQQQNHLYSREGMHQTRSYKTELNTNTLNYDSNQFLPKQQVANKNYCYKKQKYSSLPTRATQFQRNKTQLLEPNRVNQAVENKEKISKEAYLHDSMDSALAQISIGFKYQQVYQLKGNPQNIKNQLKPTNPSKYFYLIQNSHQKEQNLHQKQNDFDRKGQMKSIDGSGKLIDRLNSKLTSYIKQHQLIKEQPEPEEWNVGEMTYRTMQLNFNQLKKHR